jgi:uncharacterized protein (DUF1330 family)
MAIDELRHRLSPRSATAVQLAGGYAEDRPLVSIDRTTGPEGLASAGVHHSSGSALTAGGGRFLARGEPAKVYERRVKQRTVLIEFDSVEPAVAARDSPGYQAALAALGDGAERETRIVEGV